MKLLNWACFTALLCCCAGIAGAGDFSTYHVGNSLTGDLLSGLKYSASAHENPTNTYKWGIHRRNGTSLTWIYNIPYDSSTDSQEGTNATSSHYYNYPNSTPWTTSLPSKHWDVVTMEPYNGQNGQGGTSDMAGDTTAINGMIAASKTNNPAGVSNASTRFFIYQAWPALTAANLSNYSPIWLENANNQGTQETILNRKYFQYLFDSVKTTQPNIGMIPVGEVMYALDQKMRNNDFGSEFTSVQKLYRDTWHLNQLGCDIAGYTAYAVIFKQSPEGLASYSTPGPSAGALRIMQRTVWEVVQQQSQYTLVPEPASLGLLALGGLTMLRRRR